MTSPSMFVWYSVAAQDGRTWEALCNCRASNRPAVKYRDILYVFACQFIPEAREREACAVVLLSVQESGQMRHCCSLLVENEAKTIR